VNWVGGRDDHVNFNPSEAVASDKVGLGLMSLLPANKEVPHSHAAAEVNIVLRGKVVTKIDNQVVELGPLDALYCPAEQVHALRNHGDVAADVLWISEAPRRLDDPHY
jgi:quercetin dioxygenase-like cupin family protein